ncbi:hypothetical protein PT015_14555 [Candidatus Mycobacterium wuenschmannii]|uniref:Uncharacterized protein n=1 Tax=Candidatus Mycobacterium wuenschmannii TaxID=3027808 RepID=A0ABY8VX90_9MYCO|nr:hypothetical protein [Candidatus Mycobacterium wuenschmannii]WIM86139.1 hypothetical protein PT015_14555 [Candidatus Mycobacterium wuenschmannii]
MIFNFGSQAVSVWTYLGPMLLFGASIVATGVTFFGILKSNKTTRDATAAADKRAADDRIELCDRDFHTWRRDSLLQIGSRAIEVALNVQDDLNRIAIMPLTRDVPDIIEQSGRKIGVCGLQLRLLGAHKAGDRCRDLRTFIGSRDMLNGMLEFNQHYRRSLEPSSAHDAELTDAVRMMRARFERDIDQLNSLRGAFGETIEHELLRLSVPEQAPAKPA